MSELKYTPERIGRTDPNFESSTQLLYSFPHLREQRLKIWAGLTDTGAGLAMGPALKILATHHDILILAREAGKDAISSGMDLKPGGRLSPSRRLELMKGDVFFTGFASNSTLEELMQQAAGHYGRPSVAIEDYPWDFMHSMGPIYQARPDLMQSHLLVINEGSKRHNLAIAGNLGLDLSEERVLVTGQPAFDYIATEDIASVRRKVFSDLGLDYDTELVVFMGQKGGTKEAFEILVEGLKKSKILGEKRKLVIRRHPRGSLSADDARDMARGLEVVDTDHLPTSEIGAAADIITTIASTEGTTGVMRRKPSVHIVTPGVMALTETPKLLIPVVEDGSAIGVKDRDQITVALKTSTDPNYRRQLLERDNPWIQDGKSAEKVARALVDIGQGRL